MFFVFQLLNYFANLLFIITVYIDFYLHFLILFICKIGYSCEHYSSNKLRQRSFDIKWLNGAKKHCIFFFLNFIAVEIQRCRFSSTKSCHSYMIDSYHILFRTPILKNIYFYIIIMGFTLKTNIQINYFVLF